MIGDFNALMLFAVIQIEENCAHMFACIVKRDGDQINQGFLAGF